MDNRILIDSVEIDVEQGVEFLNDGTEEFNIGTLKLNNTYQRETYPDYADVEIVVNGTTYEMCIQKDISNRIAPNIYSHMISLAEPVIKLSQYIMADRFYTTIDGDKITYLYQLENMLDTIVFGKTSPLTIATATQTLLNVYAPEKEYVGGSFLVNLTDMFRGLKAIPTLSLNNVIGHRMIGELGTLIPSIGDIIGESITSDVGDYGLAVHSKIKSGTYEGDSLLTALIGGTYYPAKGYGVTPRTSKDKYDDDDAEYTIDSGIRRIFSARLMNLDIASTTIVAEVSYFVVSKDEWDNLEIETDATTLYNGKYKNNTFYYVEGNNVVQNVGTKYKNSTALVTGDDAMESLIKSYIVQFSAYVLADYVSQPVKEMEMEFYYQAIRDSEVRVERHSTSRVTKRATMISNQKDSTLELQRYGKANKNLINRVGNDQFEYTKRYTNYTTETIKNINDYMSDGYKIIKQRFLIRYDSVDVTYLMVKNSSVLNPVTAVNRQVSPFTISKRNILTNFVHDEYIEFSGTQRARTSKLETNGRYALMNALDWNVLYDTPLYVGQYLSTDAGSVYINMSVQRSPLGTSMGFNVQFQSPNVAGYKLVADGVLGSKIVPIRYTDENGQADTFRVKFMSETVVDENLHPLGTSSSPLLDSATYTAGLNPNEILGFTFMLHCISDRDNLIVGDYFASNNSLIRELGVEQGLTLIYYAGTVKHSIFDDYAKSGSIANGSYSVNLSKDTITISGVPSGSSWALVETASPNRLYLAYNYDGTDLNTVYVNDLLDRPNIETL